MIYGILLATAITAVIQSSGAVIGITFALIEAGVITDLTGAFPIIIGANIGTCVTGLLGSIGTHIDARRSAISHLLFNIFSTTVAALLAPYFFRWVPLLGHDLVHQAANANTLKMVLTAFMVLPFAPLHAQITRWVVPSRKKPPQPSFLDDDLFPMPEQALHAALRELRRMADLCRESLQLDKQLLDAPDRRAAHTIAQNEKTIDAVKLAHHDYLEQITSRFLSQRQAILAQHLNRCMTEIERIGDHLKVLCRLNHQLDPYTEYAFFTPCRDQLHILYDQVDRILHHLCRSLDPEHTHYEKTATAILATRKNFIKKKDTAKKLITEHVGRTDMPPRLGIYLNEYQMTFSKIARHCKVIAGAQKSPYFWLRQQKLNRPADPYSEQAILDELDESDFYEHID